MSTNTTSTRSLHSFPSLEEAAGVSGLPGQGEAGAGSRSDLQVQSCRHQLLWPGRFQPSQRVQDLPARFPWSTICCQNYQGDVKKIRCRKQRNHNRNMWK